jgi:hypothetical protein
MTWSTHTGALAQYLCSGENGFSRIRLPAALRLSRDLCLCIKS